MKREKKPSKSSDQYLSEDSFSSSKEDDSVLTHEKKSKRASKRVVKSPTVRRSNRSTSAISSADYREASSDDEFATNHLFLHPTVTDTSAVNRRVSRNKKKQAPIDDQSESESSGDGIEYRIEHILGRKSMTPRDWISFNGSRSTQELTKGSVWQQPDEEYYDNTDIPLEKFLIKWSHASYLHVSWETEKDLLEMAGPGAKAQLKKFRLREYEGVELFEDLSKGEYFPSSFLQIERILDVDDRDVNIYDVDWERALLCKTELPNIETKVGDIEVTFSQEIENSEFVSDLNPVEGVVCEEPCVDANVFEGDDSDVELHAEFPQKRSRPKRACNQRVKYQDLISSDEDDVKKVDIKEKKSTKKNKKAAQEKYLHGKECWITVKWEGLSYSEVSFENLADIISAKVDYEASLRAFYRREQKETNICASKGTRKLYLNQSILGSNSEPPPFPAGSLRDYQWEGVRWMLFNLLQGRNSILADEMGLGKTIQSSALLQMVKNYQSDAGPFLVVAPLSTIVNWQREVKAWTDLDPILYYGSQDDRELIRSYEFKFLDAKKKGYKVEVVITTPETCVAVDDKSSGRLKRELSKIAWDLIIVDEAHKLKNYESKLSTTLREEYSFRNCVLLTGTPLQNNTDELWTLLNFVASDAFGDREKFMDEFGELKTSAQLESLHKQIKPYLLRREKENVEKTVPPKVEIVIEVELTVPQKQYYRAIYEQKTGFLYKSGQKDGPSLTNLAMELRKCCNHPFLIKGAPAELAKYFKDDSPSEVLIKSSGKLTLLAKLLPKLQQDGHRVLIFSQFRMMLDIIEDYIHSAGFVYERVDGSIVGKKRQASIDRYTENSNIFIMLLSTKAGGVGINLTAADTVIIYDSDWNPQNDIQAQARAHRIGQTRDVKVYRLLTKKSYEMVMFRAASIKLGLDYAVMHNLNQTEIVAPVLANGKGRKANAAASVALAGVSTERADTVSALSKRELENLLKHGAYDIFLEEKEGKSENESKVFVEESIEQILERSSMFMHQENDAKVQCTKATSFAKASFISAGSDSTGNEVAIDDPDFWEKVVGLSVEDQAIALGAKRKCRQFVESYKEPSASVRSIYGAQNADDSDSDNSAASDSKKKKRKKVEPEIVPAEFSVDNITSIMTALSNVGYGDMDSIRRVTKLWWSLPDIAKGCRLALVACLLSSSFVVDKAVETQVDGAGAGANMSGAGNEESIELEKGISVSSANVDTTLSCEKKHIDVLSLTQFVRRYKGSKLAMCLFISEDYAGVSPATGTTFEEERHNRILAACAATSSPSPFIFRDTFERSLMARYLKGDESDSEMFNLCSSLCDRLVDEALNNVHLKAFLQVDADQNKLQKRVSASRSKLAQIEDLFEIFFFNKFMKLTEGTAISKPIEESDAAQDLVVDDSDSQKIDASLYDWLELGTETVSLPEVAWSKGLDITLLRAIAQVGYPDGKRRLSKITEYLGLENASAEKLSAKFLTQRFKSIAKTLRCTVEDMAAVAKSAAAVAAAQKQNRKKNVNSILKTVQRIGHPRSTYPAIASSIKSSSNESSEQFQRRLSYLLTWEKLGEESGVSIAAAEVQELVTAAYEIFIQKDDSVSPETLCTGVLEDTPYKLIEAAFEKADVIHHIRLLLAMHAETEIFDFIKCNCKGTGPNIPSFRRDSSMPVWWTIKHDVTLLQLIVEVGYGQWKRIISDPAICNAPIDFEMPAKVNGQEWVTTISTRTAEKRVQALLRGMPAIRSLSLPASTSPQKKMAAPSARPLGVSMPSKSMLWFGQAKESSQAKPDLNNKSSEADDTKASAIANSETKPLNATETISLVSDSPPTAEPESTELNEVSTVRSEQGAEMPSDVSRSDEAMEIIDITASVPTTQLDQSSSSMILSQQVAVPATTVPVEPLASDKSDPSKSPEVVWVESPLPTKQSAQDYIESIDAMRFGAPSESKAADHLGVKETLLNPSISFDLGDAMDKKKIDEENATGKALQTPKTQIVTHDKKAKKLDALAKEATALKGTKSILTFFKKV